MKKSLCLVLLVFLITGSVYAAGGKIIFNVYGDFLSMGKNNFTGQEKQSKIYFEAKAAVKFWRNLYLWGSHGYFPIRENWTGWNSKNSFAKDISVERTLGKRIVSGGCGFFAGFFEKEQFAARAEIGVCSITNDIDTATSRLDTDQLILNQTARQAAIGLRGNLSFTYGLYKNLFAELSGGYMYVSDKIDDVRTNLGGWHLQLGFGINL